VGRNYLGGDIALFLARNLLDEADDAAPELRILDPGECFGERKPIGRREEVGDVVRRRRRALHPGCARYARRALEEECHWNLQDMGALLKSTRTDTVGAALVFLHLLEC